MIQVIRDILFGGQGERFALMSPIGIKGVTKIVIVIFNYIFWGVIVQFLSVYLRSILSLNAYAIFYCKSY